MPDLQLADEASRLVTYLRSADLSLITAESCTAGQISAELSAVAGSGKVMEGGFVVYSPAAKLALLGLDPNWLERFNLTSVEVAEAMARAALQRSPASAALAVTGLLGSEAKDGIPPGTVCFAWAFRLPAGLALFSRRERFHGDPARMRREATRWRCGACPNSINAPCAANAPEASDREETTMSEQRQTLPAQHQDQRPGHESEMQPKPEFVSADYRPAAKLEGKVALVTGGDSGIGRAVAVAFAREKADVVLVYLDENEDAAKTREIIESLGRQCLAFAGDVADAGFCRQVVDTLRQKWGRLDVLVNNAGEQHPQARLEDISEEQWEKTFRTNIFGMFQLTKAALPLMGKGGAIINTTSITAYKGNPQLIDYSSTKGAITSFTRSLSMNLVNRGIRVNAVAPGPIWTPLIPSTFSADKVAHFGADTPMGRPGQPEELAASYVYLACNDSSYVSGQVLHVNGGTVVNG